MTLEEILPFLVPLVILQLILILLALRDLTRADRRVKGGDKRIWAIIILIGQLWGPLLYFAIGRENE